METASILQIAAKIMHDLGAGYSESIYQNALYRNMARTDCTCVMEKSIPVVYEGDVLGTCRADIVTESLVIEVKAVRKMPSGVEKQVCKYVRHRMEKQERDS
jgi:GxxExxY protein